MHNCLFVCLCVSFQVPNYLTLFIKLCCICTRCSRWLLCQTANSMFNYFFLVISNAFWIETLMSGIEHKVTHTTIPGQKCRFENLIHSFMCSAKFPNFYNLNLRNRLNNQISLAVKAAIVSFSTYKKVSNFCRLIYYLSLSLRVRACFEVCFLCE